MSSNDLNEWNHGEDLQSYSFDNFYEKNEPPIQGAFDIELSVDHIPFKYEHALLDTKMETYESENSRIVWETEDYFCINEPAAPLNQLHQVYEDPPHPHPILFPVAMEEDEPFKQKREKKIKKPSKTHKNQYDKNIFANINAVILKKLVAPQAQQELRVYCEHHQIILEDFRSHFLKLQREKFRFGTTQLFNLYESQELLEGWKQVFGMFCVRFLRGEYVQYVLREGRMQEREKYLRCATKMMYIPRLRQEEYHIISCLMNKVVDI